MDQCSKGLFTALLVLVVLLALPVPAISGATQRVVILREGSSISLGSANQAVELLKIRGYAIDVRFQGKKQTLKRGDSLSIAGGECAVMFQKISPETRIARFLTDCD